jgi:hypothetical protein
MSDNFTKEFVDREIEYLEQMEAKAKAASSFAAPTLLERIVDRMDAMRTQITRSDPALKCEYMRGAHYSAGMCIGIVREEIYKAKMRSNDKSSNPAGRKQKDESKSAD